MRLYHVPHTRSTRVLWILEEVGTPYDLTVLTREDTRTPEHDARHPIGKVPVMDDRGTYLFESSALILHVADSNPDAGLLAAPGTLERAQAYQWAFYSMLELESQVIEFYYHKDSDPTRAAAGREAFRKNAKPLDDLFGKSDYVVGNAFSAADVVVCGVLGFARFVGLTDGLDNVNAYVERMDARPARQRANAVT